MSENKKDNINLSNYVSENAKNIISYLIKLYCNQEKIKIDYDIKMKTN